MYMYFANNTMDNKLGKLYFNHCYTKYQNDIYYSIVFAKYKDWPKKVNNEHKFFNLLNTLDLKQQITMLQLGNTFADMCTNMLKQDQNPMSMEKNVTSVSFEMRV